MPWQNQGGGGPWGGGSGGGGPGPWGRGPGGGSGPQPPNIEELLRRGQDRMRAILPGGMGSMRGLILIALIAVAVWLFSGIYRVQPEQQGIVLRFGQYVRDAAPGLNYHWPSPIETVLTPSVTRENRLEIGYRSGAEGRSPISPRDLQAESLMLTGDENIVDINFTVFWRIKDAREFLFDVRDPEALVKVAAESAMREVIGKTPIQQALTEGRDKIQVDTQALLQRLLDSYRAGVEIRRVQLLAVDPPAQVVDAFNDVQRARADRERLSNEAEAYRNDVIPRARGDAQRLIQEAQAYRAEVTNRAEGDAKRFLAIYQAYLANKDVTAQRMYLETMEQVLKNTSKVILDRNETSQGVVPYLPLPELKPKTPAPEAKP